jgi:hypothetical protein
MPTSDKHSSLLRHRINWGRKKYFDAASQSEEKLTLKRFQGGNGSSGSGSSAGRKPIRIHGATSLYSLRSLSREEERAKFGKKGRSGAPPKKVVRGISLENEYSEFDERDDVDIDGVGVVDDTDADAGIRKSDLQVPML